MLSAAFALASHIGPLYRYTQRALHVRTGLTRRRLSKTNDMFPVRYMPMYVYRQQPVGLITTTCRAPLPCHRYAELLRRRSWLTDARAVGPPSPASGTWGSTSAPSLLGRSW